MLVTVLRGSPTGEGGFKKGITISEGADCILTDYDHRRVVIGYPIYLPTTFAVLNMDSPGHVTTRQIPYKGSDGMYGVYILNPPGRQGMIALAFTGALKGLSIESAAAAPSSLPVDMMQYIQVEGRSGGGLQERRNDLWVGGSPLSINLPGLPGIRVGLPRPPGLPPTQGAAALLVNNMSLGIIVSAPQTLSIFNKLTGEWKSITIPFMSYRARAFGAWIGAIAEEPGWLASVTTARADARLQLPRQEEFRAKNPGAEKRKTETLPYTVGNKTMTVDDFFTGDTAVYPGKLLVFNPFTGFMASITTGEADSEVLLIEDNSVFYRVNDEIFRSRISGGGLEKPQRIASGNGLFQVHWAFLSTAKE